MISFDIEIEKTIDEKSSIKKDFSKTIFKNTNVNEFANFDVENDYLCSFLTRFERDLIKNWARSRQDLARIQSISLWSSISLIRNQAFITRMNTIMNKEIEVKSCVVLYMKQRDYFCIKILQNIKRLFAKKYLLDILYYCFVEILFCYISRHSTFYINHISNLTHILLRSEQDITNLNKIWTKFEQDLSKIWARFEQDFAQYNFDFKNFFRARDTNNSLQKYFVRSLTYIRLYNDKKKVTLAIVKNK